MKLKLKCLVVDDNEDVLDAYSFFLGSHGHEVVKATGAIGAIEILMIEQFDLIITDKDMPAGNEGFEVIRQARIQCPKAIIWMASGRMDNNFRNTAKALGANEAFAKPEPIIEAIKGLLQKHSVPVTAS